MGTRRGPRRPRSGGEILRRRPGTWHRPGPGVGVSPEVFPVVRTWRTAARRRTRRSGADRRNVVEEGSDDSGLPNAVFRDRRSGPRRRDDYTGRAIPLYDGGVPFGSNHTEVCETAIYTATRGAGRGRARAAVDRARRRVRRIDPPHR